jgi:hypothetical protein
MLKVVTRVPEGLSLYSQLDEHSPTVAVSVAEACAVIVWADPSQSTEVGLRSPPELSDNARVSAGAPLLMAQVRDTVDSLPTKMTSIVPAPSMVAVVDGELDDAKVIEPDDALQEENAYPGSAVPTTERAVPLVPSL